MCLINWKIADSCFFKKLFITLSVGMSSDNKIKSDSNDWHRLSLDDVFAILQTDKYGLSDEQFHQRERTTILSASHGFSPMFGRRGYFFGRSGLVLHGGTSVKKRQGMWRGGSNDALCVSGSVELGQNVKLEWQKKSLETR